MISGSSAAPVAAPRDARSFARSIRRLPSALWFGRLVRFAVVGLISNGLLLLLFTGLLSAGLDAVAAAVLVYAIGVLGSYLANRNWTFRSNARHRTGFASYVMVHGFGAALTAVVLFVFNGRLGYPAVPVECGAILLSAMSTFGLLHVVVFKNLQTSEAPTLSDRTKLGP